MTRIHDDPATFAEDALAGFARLHADTVRPVTGGVVRRTPGPRGKVAVVVGGGSGHYPAFCGLVGPGFADGAVVGNVFTSPSASWAYSVGKAAHRGGGVVFSYGNYAGDVMNFGLATEQLRAEGVDARNVVVTDDVLSAPPHEAERRRGIAGDLVVFKVMSAAAEAGAGIDDVERLGRLANERTRTVGVALAGCTIPGQDAPLFTVERGSMAVGMGIHGEPGLDAAPLRPAAEIAADLVERVLAEAPGDSDRLAVVLNGLGATKYEELFLLWNHVAPMLEARGATLVAPEVGELVTSLDMAGLSLTVTWLDDELEPLWCAPAAAPGFRRGSLAGPLADDDAATDDEGGDEDAQDELPDASDASRAAAPQVVAALARALRAVHDAEEELARLDSVAGDGDHGRGMVRGLEAAHGAAVEAAGRGAGAGTVLVRAGDAWAAQAGGTSGVLWGSGLRALGAALGDDAAPDLPRLVAGARAFADTLVRLGKAERGDKTMLDAVLPVVEVLEQIGVSEGGAPHDALAVLADVADAAARETARLTARRGRARPHAERSVGTPDPGAVSFAAVVRAVVTDEEVGE